MKRTVALLLILAVLFSVTSAAYIENQLADIKYDGIIYVTHNGNIVYQRATGTDANGDPLTIDTSMCISDLCQSNSVPPL